MDNGQNAAGGHGALLLTAFGWFDGGPNCSAILLETLRRQWRELATDWPDGIAFACFDVDSKAVEMAFSEEIGRVAPSHVLMMGQAAGAAALRLERTARNTRDFRVADAAGRLGPQGPVRAGGPDILTSNWPDLEGAVRAIRHAGVPAELSDDAGSHLCNQTLYLALEAAERAPAPFAATFLHLPLLPEQVAAGAPAARGPSCPSVALDDMARAVRAVLRHTRRVARVQKASRP